MWFKSINSRGDFIFEKQGLKIFELKFPKWYSHRAVVIFGKSNIEIKPKSIWKSEYIILKNNQKKRINNIQLERSSFYSIFR